MAAVLHDQLVQKLTAVNQQHLFQFYGQLTSAQQVAFDQQLASLDWTLIHQLVETVVKHPEKFALPHNVQPAPYYEHRPSDPAKKEKLCQAFARGEELLRTGKVAAFVVAGGQGTRLGWDAPKGTFPATPIKRKPLFQCFAEYLLAMGRRCGRDIPLYVMTSPLNDAPTRAYWKEHHNFCIKAENLMFFPQDSLPAVSIDGKVLLEQKDSLALSPNGHGGSLLALFKSGAIADMARRGITQISYFQVDNPVVRCVDPLFLGLHDLDGAQMSSKMLHKVAPKEKLGNFCLIDGKVSIIEYSDLPDELAEQRLPNGDLRFRAGSIALHAIRRDFVEELNGHGFTLPYHRAEKKVPYIDPATGQTVKPHHPNAVKMETLVFDALPLARTSIIYETDRVDDFAPIKNPEGVDSAVSSRQITSLRNALWLKAAGIAVPMKPATGAHGEVSVDGQIADCTLEIAPSFALYPDDVKANKDKVPTMKAGAEVYLE